jgi:hypothetical protein
MGCCGRRASEQLPLTHRLTPPKVSTFSELHKPMLTRISLIVAIVAGLAVAGLNFAKVKGSIDTLKTNLAEETSAKQTAISERDSTKKALDQTTKERDEAKAEIAGAQEARDKAVAEAENQTKRAGKIADDLSKTRQELADAQTDLSAWKAVGIPVEKISGLVVESKQMRDRIISLVETNKVYDLKIRSLKSRLAVLEGEEDYRVELPASLKGKVLVADPKWDFVVLDIGQNQGVLEDGVMLVNRNGRLVAKVQVRSVQGDRSIANVLPNWKLGEVMEGDQVIP